MFSRPFQILSTRMATVVAICVVVLVSPFATSSSRASIASQPDQTPILTGAVRNSVSQAPSNFAAWRAGVKSTDVYGVTYKPNAKMQHLCPTCIVADEFATADSGERYAVTFNWIVAKSWSRPRTLVYIQQNIGKLLSSYTMTQGTDDNGENWFDWTKSSPAQFVFVKTFSNSKQNGFEVRIGHYQPKNLHYIPYAILNTTQRTNLANAVKSYVQLGIQNVSDNFSSLRGKATDKDNNYFDTNVSFGEYMTSCDVDGIFSNIAADNATSKWILECETPALGGAKSDIEDLIRAAVAGALPDGFSLTTDPKYASMTDYRWDRSSDTVAVEITSYDNDDGTFTYHVYVYHFLS